MKYLKNIVGFGTQSWCWNSKHAWMWTLASAPGLVALNMPRERPHFETGTQKDIMWIQAQDWLICLFICFKGSMKEREERQKEMNHPWSTPQMTTMNRVGACWNKSWEIHARLPCGWLKFKYLDRACLPLQVRYQEATWKQSNHTSTNILDAGLAEQRLNLLLYQSVSQIQVIEQPSGENQPGPYREPLNTIGPVPAMTYRLPVKYHFISFHNLSSRWYPESQLSNTLNPWTQASSKS